MSKVKKIGSDINKFVKKPLLLYIFLIPLFISIVVSLFYKEFLLFGIKIVGFIILYISIKLIDRGMVEEQKYNRTKITKAPKYKYKMIGYFGVALAIVLLEVFVNKSSFIEIVIEPIIAFTGLLLYYGKDPFKDKLPDMDVTNIEKLLDAIKEAEDKVAFIEKIKEDIDDLELKYAIERALKRAKDIIDSIKSDPKDYYSSRKFMVVYLDGIKDVITKYRGIDKSVLDKSYRDRLIQLLDRASVKFEEDLQKLKSNELFDLDVQIDSLKKQLQE